MQYSQKNNIFIEQNHKITGPRMSDSLYAKAIASLIVVCSDAIIVDYEKKLIYLAKRSVKPMQGYWTIGGRRKAGDSSHDSIVKTFLRETSIVTKRNQFSYISTKEVIWKDRKERPINIGKHDLIQFFAIELSKAQLSKASNNLCKNEYEPSGLKGFDKSSLKINKIHPLMLEIYNEIF